MLTCQNLTITHRKDGRVLVRDFSFTPKKGEHVAVIGEEGNGKSTLVRLMHDPALIADYADWEGIVSKGSGADRSATAYLPQEPEPALAALPVWEYLGTPDADVSRMASLADELALDPGICWSERAIGTFSGGEQMKIRLLRLLRGSPDVLLLDEPSNDLDLGALVWLEEWIAARPETVIFISHDEVLLENTAECVIHLEQVMRKTEPRWTVSRAGYREYAADRQDRIERAAAQAKNDRAAFEKKMERYRHIYERVHHEQNAISRQNPSGGRLLKKKMHTVKAMEHRFERERETLTKKIDAEEQVMIDFPPVKVPAGKVILDLDLPALSAPDGRVLQRDIRMRVTGGEKWVITGPNGCGKTTLMREIAARLLPRRDLSAAYMPQDYAEQLDQGADPVTYLRQALGDWSEPTAVKIRTWLGSIKFTAAEMAHPIGELSGGQRAKLCFLEMILKGADVLLLDEPTRNLSPMTAPVIRRIVADFTGTVIAVSHDRKFIEEVAEEELALNGGIQNSE
ncbi:MAG: ATP-binding cassette domain-containing protein [Clostridiales bacterium]|nr:ATP-binding cassette domain-containing protein [Clostridiales bacterium]